MTRLAIVTGVSRGLGEALARELLQRGYAVIGIARHDAQRLAHARYRFVRFDLADAQGIDDALGQAFAEAAAAQPTAAVLLNNAASAGPAGVFGALAASELAASLALNLGAPAVLANLFCRTFTATGCDRRIINVSSGAAERALPGASAYCAAKAGLEMVTRVIAAEQGSDGVHCVTLRPGIIDTDMQAYMRGQSRDTLPSVGLFQGFHRSGQLVPAAIVAGKVIDRLVESPVEPGRTYSYAEL